MTVRIRRHRRSDRTPGGDRSRRPRLQTAALRRRSPGSREELAKDVAALANHRGGVLVIGMAESRGVPSRAFDVDLDDRHIRDLQQRIASSTAPSVRVGAVPQGEPRQSGARLPAYCRSPKPARRRMPSLCRRRIQTLAALRYPRRAGSRTDWLTETYVATAYRQRFSSLPRTGPTRTRDIEASLVTSELSRERTRICWSRWCLTCPARCGSTRVPSLEYREQILAAHSRSIGSGDTTVSAGQCRPPQADPGAARRPRRRRPGPPL